VSGAEQHSRVLTRRTEFQNCDLDVRSRTSLLPLLEAWPWAQTPGRKHGSGPRWLLLSPRGSSRTAEQAVRQLVRLIDRLPPAAKRCWAQASSRVFDIGVQAGLTPTSFQGVKLSAETLRAVARVRGRVLMTVYAPTHDEPDEAEVRGRPTPIRPPGVKRGHVRSPSLPGTLGHVAAGVAATPRP
jgi:hypothetical protein